MNIHGSLMDIFDQKKKSFKAIYDHSQARSAKTFMNIHGSLMDIFDQKKKSFKAIYDHSKRGAQKHL